MDDGPEDPRLEELASLEAIFPEIQRPDDKDPFTFALELPVKPANTVAVTFPAAASTATSSDLTAAAATATSQSDHIPGTNGAGPQNQVHSHNVSYLPPVLLRMSLPPAYPSGKPPRVGLHTTPEWLPPAVIKTLEADAARLWEEMGHDMVAYTYIDHVQQAAEEVFGMVNPLGTLEVDLSHMAAILDHDIKATRAAFETETFDCGVCLGTRFPFATPIPAVLKTNFLCRSQKGYRLPQDDGLRPRLLPVMPARVLRRGYQAGRRQCGAMP